MTMPKPTDADFDRFRGLVPERPDVTTKPMFGNIAAFVNGNMFMGLFGADVGVRLDPAAKAELVASGGGPFGPSDRPMAAYVTLPHHWSDAEAELWVDRALDHVSTVPAKVAKPRRNRLDG